MLKNIIYNKELLDFDAMLSYIASLIRGGFTTGYYPHWELIFTGIGTQDISDYSLEHIGQCVATGYKEGEIIEESADGFKIEKGWWKITI